MSDAQDRRDVGRVLPVLAMRPAEAAEALGVSARLLWSMTKSGEIPHTRLGRAVIYPVDELRAWLAERATGEGVAS